MRFPASEFAISPMRCSFASLRQMIFAVLLDVLLYESLDQGVARWTEGTAFKEDLTQWDGLVDDPNVERAEQTLSTDEVVLQGEQAE